MESIYMIAFITGLFSFLAPCIIPMLTVYFTLITGLSVEELQSVNMQHGMKKHVVINTLIFISAFTLVFTLVGGLVGSAGNILQEKMRYINLIGGVFIIILALKMMGLIKLEFLSRVNIKNRISIDYIPRDYKYLSTFLVGLFFAIVCSHCIGPTLYSMLVLAGTPTTKVNGALLMFLFSIGLAIPYFLIGLAFNKAIPVIKKLGEHQKKIQIIMGGVLIIFAILIISNELTILTKLIKKLMPFELPYSM